MFAPTHSAPPLGCPKLPKLSMSKTELTISSPKESGLRSVVPHLRERRRRPLPPAARKPRPRASASPPTRSASKFGHFTSQATCETSHASSPSPQHPGPGPTSRLDYGDALDYGSLRIRSDLSASHTHARAHTHSHTHARAHTRLCTYPHAHIEFEHFAAPLVAVRINTASVPGPVSGCPVWLLQPLRPLSYRRPLSLSAPVTLGFFFSLP